MKKTMKKMISLSLALMLLFSIAGCADGNNQNDANVSPSSSPSSSPSQSSSPEPSKPAEPEKISILTYGQVDFEYNANLPVLAEIEKRTNIKIDWQNLPVGAEEQKLDLIFAGGTLPDVLIWSDQSKIIKLGSDGILIPLEGYIENNAPNIKKEFERLSEEIEFFNERVTSLDGHIYNIPTFTPAGNNAGMTWAIREDWCKNVGLSIPTTTDELYTVLKAFKEKDPNGNGEADELPLVSRNSNYYLTFLANSFGAQQGLFWDDEAKEVRFGITDPRFKDAIAYINKLYMEGLIDPEYITNTDDQFNAKITDNRAGMMLGYANSTIGAGHDSLKNQNPEFNLVSMLPVAGPEGYCFKQDAGSRINFRASITKDCKNPETAIKLFDYCFSDEGHELLTWGIDGETFVEVNGKKQVLDYVLRNPDGLTPMQAVNLFGIDPSLPHCYDLEAYNNLSTPFVATIFELYSKPGILVESLSIQLTPEETEKTDAMGDLFTYYGPMISKFITGKEPMENWDAFVEQCVKFGAEEFRKINDTAYKRQFGLQ